MGGDGGDGGAGGGGGDEGGGMHGNMELGTWQMYAMVEVQGLTTQPYLRSVPAVVWYSACVFCCVVLVGSRPDHWS